MVTESIIQPVAEKARADEKASADEKTSTAADEQPACEVSVVMPCLNEAETLATCIRKAMSSLEEHDIDGEVVVGDNGSTDGSQEIARREGARVVDVPQRGYGAALMGAIHAARGQYVLMADSDDQHDLENLHTLVEKIREGHDMVMGNRFEGGIQPGAMPPLHRYLGTPVLSFIGRLFFNSDLSDFNCGYRIFDREKILALGLRTTGMEFASEMIVKAELASLDIAEVPTRVFPDGRSGDAHLNTWSDGWRHLRFLLLYSPRWLFMVPGLVLMMIGFALGGWLYLSQPLQLGPLALDVHTLLYAALAVLVGFQSLWFGIFSKVFAVNAGLHPPDKMIDTINTKFHLESGLIGGALLTLAGLSVTGYSVLHWEWFKSLSYSTTLRMVIPSFLAVALGIQIVLSSFFVSILGLKRQ